MASTKNEMVINYVPGDECRVAVVEDGKLEEFHAERADAVSHVGNIYVGKVKNVEPAIQAAFVDFGLEQNGFLHVSDLHPQYFPGEGDETTEMVGKKTPRRERPPIQECLRRGQEIAVQVLKEGVGTKGPTVTSYLSIPGRFLVMMPNMDRVGVSRKVEDEETRRKMREILDQLELPDGFGFIVRTAGMERTKAELKRDLAYLARLWKDIEKRWGKGGNKPRLLYSESDLLMRALRDMVTTDLDRIVIDDESAMMRAARFLKIVAPRSSTKLVRYTGRTPVFHAMGIEEQIRTMYSREVPLPSGGRLVIDETEALVAIDVNSGKMRDARDAETNAYRTNLEAAEEICRQLKLRDVGGIVVNDLIDMRSLKHRREIEHKFKELLKKDRARTTLEQISQFGILEMTRQRMRGSYESVHFADCPICRGRGLVQRPDSVATDAMRELAALLEHERVARIEMAVGPRIAGELLSSKRRSLNRLERASGKHVEVRVSESVPVDRVTFYCYDDRGADIDVGRIALPRAKAEELQEFEIRVKTDEDWAVDAEQEAKSAAAIEPPEPEPAREEAPDAFLEALEHDEGMAAADDEGGDQSKEQGGGGRGRRGRRGGRGRGRGGRPPEGEGRGRGGEEGGGERRPAEAAPAHANGAPRAPSEPAHHGQAPQGGGGPARDGEEGGGGRRRRRRRRGRGRGRGGEQGGPGAPTDGTPIFDEEGMPSGDQVSEPAPAPKSSEPSSWDVGVGEAAPGANEPGPEADAGVEGEYAGSPHGEGDDAQGDEHGHGRPDDDGQHHGGTNGAPGGPDGGEQGGRRRRRRRRRGGRGRSGDQVGGAGGDNRAGGAPPAAPAPASSHDMAPVDAAEGPDMHEQRDDVADGAPSPSADHADEWDGAVVPTPQGDESHGQEGEREPQGPGGDQGGGGRRRRRRRGRGGRGGGGGNGGGNGGGGGNASGGGGGEARGGGGQGGGQGGGHREGDRRRDGRQQGGGGGGRQQPRQPQQQQQRQSQPPRPQQAPRADSGQSRSGSNPAPTPRVLYSSRRKLSPSERGKIKPE